MKVTRVTLRQKQLDHLIAGNVLTIRLKELDFSLELRFDSLAVLSKDNELDFMDQILGRKIQ